MKSVRFSMILITMCILILPINIYSQKNSGENSEIFAPIKFGTIPVLQSLPLFVANEKGFFKKQGLYVEIILFNSALEKDVALTTGQIAGYFGDLMTPIVLQANNYGVKIVSENYNTKNKRRMFAILASKQSKSKNITEISKKGITTSSNTIAEYLIVRMLQPHKISKEAINLIDVKNIPIRLQMLLSGKVPAALLPEPLATLAEMKGATALIDDRSMGISVTVFAFSEKFLRKYPQTVKAFHRAINAASDYINKNPDKVRTIMNRNCKMPEPLQASFPIPEFPRLIIPARDQVTDVYNWLRQKQIIKKDIVYRDIIADGFLP